MDKENTHRQRSEPEEKNEEREAMTEREDSRKETKEMNARKEEHFRPSTRSFVAVGVDPAVMGIIPAAAILAAVKSPGLELDDINLFEINEILPLEAKPCILDKSILQCRENILYYIEWTDTWLSILGHGF
ncbi:3-ketoacyl-CoA thiolase 2, peroxisomal [Camellia lanceoleosa]|uniref:3-ketoacyl-CoA thiolase 2, peroxisomal n=1 Tax=Camellia lanceoleosa TaxID=1840588 RepID=A0ACC0J5Z5_9ERIC|nr:3-ketoacyl-CoA thiolase 2, peroxisomal [Camellia lanceoleosa]